MERSSKQFDILARFRLENWQNFFWIQAWTLNLSWNLANVGASVVASNVILAFLCNPRANAGVAGELQQDSSDPPGGPDFTCMIFFSFEFRPDFCRRLSCLSWTPFARAVCYAGVCGSHRPRISSEPRSPRSPGASPRAGSTLPSLSPPLFPSRSTSECCFCHLRSLVNSALEIYDV